MQCVNGSASYTIWTYQLDRPAKQTSLIDHLNGPAWLTSWKDQLNGLAGQTSWMTSSFYLKLWPVRIFEDFPFSLYIVAASESDEGLVLCPSISTSTTLQKFINCIWIHFANALCTLHLGHYIVHSVYALPLFKKSTKTIFNKYLKCKEKNLSN